MSIRLTDQTIQSFVGNVVPLRLLGVTHLGTDPITWTLEGDCVHLKTFGEETKKFNHQDVDPFTDGVLLTFMAPGCATVTATYEGVEYRCEVSVRERRTFTSEEADQFFVGDMHDHTWSSHNRAEFTNRPEEVFPARYIQQTKEEGKLDFGVVSDHACILNRREFYRGFSDAQDAEPMDQILFPGSEAEVTAIELDRFGIPHKNSGEIVTVNANTFAGAGNWVDFFRAYQDSPFAVCTLAHPLILGHSTPGIWNFSVENNNCPRFRQMIKLIEMGDGTDRNSNLINECIYSQALDHGFRVSTTCSSDSHGPIWGYERIPGKTVIMASEKSREAFLDAMWNNRVYASCSGNIKLRYSVNGKVAPADLDYATKYRFHVEVSYFYEDPTTVPVKMQVISNGGECIKEFEGVDFSSFDFEVDSTTACWFYLRLWDEDGRKTWSPPIFTHRQPFTDNTNDMIPMKKEGFTAVEENTGEDVSVLLCDDPYQEWKAKSGTCSILIDMKEEKIVNGLGSYPRFITRPMLKEEGVEPCWKIAEFPSHYRISTSQDGEKFVKRAEGIFRIYGGEEIIRFENCRARYIRFEVLSTVGRYSERKDFFDCPVALAELTPYHKYQKPPKK